MRRILLLTSVVLLCYNVFSQQPRSITISLGTLTCKFREDLRPDAEMAFKLMSVLYSSREFQDSLAQLSFPDNSCYSCGSGTINSGEAILNVLFSRTSETWDLVVKKRGGALGETTPQKNYTTAFYNKISDDMCNLPFPVALAVNLSHEYMHHICFCHPKEPKDGHLRKPLNDDKCDNEFYDPISYRSDVAYRVGWIAYDILLRWHKEGKLSGLH